jgi:hypothetical protein
MTQPSAGAGRPAARPARSTVLGGASGDAAQVHPTGTVLDEHQHVGAGDPVGVKSVQEGCGQRHEADEVAHRLGAGDVKTPLMPLDETILIMETMDAVLAQAGENA